MSALDDLAAAEAAYDAAEAAIAELEADIATARAAYDSLAADPESTWEQVAAASWALHLLTDRMSDRQAARSAAINRGYLAASRAGLLNRTRYPSAARPDYGVLDLSGTPAAWLPIPGPGEPVEAFNREWTTQ